MPYFTHEGLNFHYLDQGQGLPFFFQHGLGGDVSQPFGLFNPPPGFRLLAFDCRAHGQTQPLGDAEKIGLASFADDLLALMDHLHLPRAIVGGISMGAAVALNFILRFPERVLGLILSRPAWLDGPLSQRTPVYGQIAQLIRQYGPKHGLEMFKQSADYLEILRQSPDSANSLVGQFEEPRAKAGVVRLERLPHDTPSRNRAEWSKISVPTLVLANRQDPIHPFAYGEILAQAIPGAEFREMVPKSVSKDQHAANAQAFIEEFLLRHFSDNYD